MSRRKFLQRGAVAGLGASVGLGAYARWVEPHWVEVVECAMPLANLPAPLVGKRLVQISDLHVGNLVDDGYLRETMERVVALRPDYVVVTGDLMTTRFGEQAAKAVDTLRLLRPNDRPVVAILGNHDFGRGYRQFHGAMEVARGLRKAGAYVLRNESIELNGLQIAGAGELWAGECDLRRTLEWVDPDRPALALVHNPDTVDLAGWESFRGWVLAGHTHGGQVRIPGFGVPLLPIRNRNYAAGHVPLCGGRDLYVNRGLGYTRRVRFCVRPEVTVFTLAVAGRIDA
ncbi:MAG: metallophosphoesterase [Lacipirellulaceae bacterium]